MAIVCRVERWVVRAKGREHSGWLPRGAATPPSSSDRDVVLDLWIEGDDGGFLLLWQIAEHSPCFPGSELRAGDTWHASVDEAKRQAAFEFGVPLGVWKSP